MALVAPTVLWSAPGMAGSSFSADGQLPVRASPTGGGRELTSVDFSPDGRLLAANDRIVANGRSVAAVLVFRTDDWTPVPSVGDGSLLVRWSGSGSIRMCPMTTAGSSSGATTTTYDFGADVFGGDIGPAGTSAFDVHAAPMP